MAASQQSHPPKRASLYVGDLQPETTEADLTEAFSKIRPISSVRLCRCNSTGKSLCYGYVNFFSVSDASDALAFLNHTDLRGKPMRIMWSQRNPILRKNGFANLFVKNLDPSINNARMQSLFCKFGTILSSKVAEENGNSKGFGFVQFDTEESATAARIALHDTMLEGKKLYVSKFVRNSNKTVPSGELKFTNVYVKNLVKDLTEDLLRDIFSVHGKVCNVAIMKDCEGKSRGFGFVSFESPEEAKKAVGALNGVLLGSKTLFVARAQKKAERMEILKREYKYIQKLKASNVYVKNLDDSIDDNKFKEVFSACGQITSAKVMRHVDGSSKRFGFVCFSTPEEAKKALDTLNGTTFKGRTLYVAVAQRKEDRCRELQKYFANCPPHSIYTPNCNFVSPQCSPLYLRYAPSTTPFPSPHQPTLYQRFGANLGVQYPFTAQNGLHNFSTDIPMGQTPQGNAGTTENFFYRHHNMKYGNFNDRSWNLDHRNTEGQTVGFWKKENKRSRYAESSSRAFPAVRRVIRS